MASIINFGCLASNCAGASNDKFNQFADSGLGVDGMVDGV
jgi:hypothetical protein